MKKSGENKVPDDKSCGGTLGSSGEDFTPQKGKNLNPRDNADVFLEESVCLSAVTGLKFGKDEEKGFLTLNSLAS